MQTVMTLVPNHPGILERAAALLQRRGLRLSGASLSPSARPGFARLTMLVHDEDLAAVMAQLERHILANRTADPTPADAPTPDRAPYRWQADGAMDEESA